MNLANLFRRSDRQDKPSLLRAGEPVVHPGPSQEILGIWVCVVDPLPILLNRSQLIERVKNVNLQVVDRADRSS